jgi:cysteine desulfurase
MKTALPIYLDYNATTPVAPEVLTAMLPYLSEHLGNPSSSHSYGIRARQAVGRDGIDHRRAGAGLLLAVSRAELQLTPAESDKISRDD